MDLGWAVRTTVSRPFADRRSGEMIEAMEELRDVCVQEDEVQAWNTFVF